MSARRPVAALLNWLLTLGFLSPVASLAADYTLVVAGLGGEPQYEARFREQAEAVADAARQSGVEAANVTALSGPAATAQGVTDALAALSQRMKAQDALTIVLIGHGTFDGEEYRFNLPGPDLTGTQLAALFDAAPARRQLIVNATSASGAVAERWRRDERIVVTATKNGGERTATRFAQYWLKATSSDAADVNKDDLVTAAEAFAYAQREVETAYKTDVSLATEHARLEGDAAEQFAVARFGAARDSSGDARVAALLSQRGALELELNEVKERKAELAEDAYYDALEGVLVRLALLQRQIDARQSTLTGGGS